jgi:glycosyltransferase involved in cell wall biosynthesis
MSNPVKLTVVTPTYNQAPFIAQTLQSVLDQHIGSELQYIVQDACSTDGTAEIAQAFADAFTRQGVHWRYVREEDDGQSDGINRGWRQAEGDIVAFLNSDDLYRPGALRTVLDYFTDHPDTQWAYGGWRLVGKSGRPYKTVAPPPYRHSALLNHCYIGQPACFLRRNLLAEVGLLNTDLHLAMDYDLWLRIARLHSAGTIPAILADMRYYRDAKSAASVREQTLEIFRLGKGYSRPWSWRRLRQTYYCLRGLASVTVGHDISRRIENMERASRAEKE